MKLEVILGEQVIPVEVRDEVVQGAGDVFSQMDADMNQGIQAGRYWIDMPDTLQRCQYVANRLATALENEDPPMQQMMAGYILSRMPGVKRVAIDMQGEMQLTEFDY